jgi:hypothetical protein
MTTSMSATNRAKKANCQNWERVFSGELLGSFRRYTTTRSFRKVK